ncbi:pentapeptide repeat-containing protein [Burkholderia cepacia]|uniref:pentapeptide repeat-containing protein n=1 Tax=Burkholderia cepacia TaxID=292 RepID=UPI0029906F29|nr:pentapeptide repeat-containing protein [Burkholderia cepacia]MDW9242914.1 pentapeptide repeats family protein [Burkholderia cepacia]
MKIEILNRWTLKVIFECEADSMKAAVELACQQGVSLSGSNLSGSNLSDSDLSGSDLSGSDLRGSDLSGSNLSDSDLSGSDLRGSDLSGSNLSDSDLSGSDLRGSDLSGSNLSDSDLSGSNLRGSDLRGSNLSGSNLSDSDLSGSDLSGSDLRGSDLSGSNLLPIKADFIEVISQAPREVPALIEALKAGRVDGSTYSGECACLVGTIANARGIDVDSSELGIPKDSSRPIERFFMTIRKGDTPETNAASKLALEWAMTWLDTQRKAFSS